jgi:AcrR family transcriptional regulator
MPTAVRGATRDPVVTRERILDAADAALRRYGVRRASMNDVATIGRISRGSIYRYFPDREALLSATLERAARRFVAASEPSVRRRRSLAAQVAEAAVFIRTHLDDEVLTFHTGVQDAAMGTLLATQMESLLSDFVDFWPPYLAAAERRGEIRTGLDHRRVSEWIVRLMASFVTVPSVVVDLDDTDQVRAFVQDFVVDGLRPWPPTSEGAS